jgi:glycosyltransferase involved in cell wall biosynthesis
MKLLARVRLAAPWHGAGAEVYLHSVLRDLVRRGHEARVLVAETREARVVDGVGYEPATRVGFWRPDVVIGQLDHTNEARDLAVQLDAPFAAIFHNHRQPAIYGHTPENTAVGIWNSSWTRDAADGFGAHGVREYAAVEIVAHPPVDPDDYHVAGDLKPPAGDVTLVNLQPEKGVHVAVDLARRMPDTSFLFVVGAYGTQVRPAPGRPPNITVIGPVAPREMSSLVYARTRVLLMPSDYESFGRCAIEAAHAGAPTVAHPTGGLCEALGYGGAGIYAHRDRLDAWVAALRCLEDPAAYECHADAARARAVELASENEGGYDRIEAALEAACRS